MDRFFKYQLCKHYSWQTFLSLPICRTWVCVIRTEVITCGWQKPVNTRTLQRKNQILFLWLKSLFHAITSNEMCVDTLQSNFFSIGLVASELFSWVYKHQTAGNCSSKSCQLVLKEWMNVCGLICVYVCEKSNPHARNPVKRETMGVNRQFFLEMPIHF